MEFPGPISLAVQPPPNGGTTGYGTDWTDPEGNTPEVDHSLKIAITAASRGLVLWRGSLMYAINVDSTPDSVCSSMWVRISPTGSAIRSTSIAFRISSTGSPMAPRGSHWLHEYLISMTDQGIRKTVIAASILYRDKRSQIRTSRNERVRVESVGSSYADREYSRTRGVHAR